MLAAGCGGTENPAKAAPPATPAAQPASATAPARTATKAAASPAAISSHDDFASRGIACVTCHPCGAPPVHATAWMDRASAGFHAVAADSGLAGCQSCHGPQLDGVGGSSAVSCAMCHGAGWTTRCTMCHGGAESQTGAPPAATWGHAGDPNRGGGTPDPVRVGAHTAHLAATHGLAAPLACSSCHVVPADALAPGHADAATATVTFSGLGARGTPAWTRASATCSGVYCHGATLDAGGARTAPVWTTTDGSQIACGSCHGAPPPLPHPQNASCGNCHAGYTSTTVDQALHVNGALDVAAMTCTSCHGSAGQTATASAPRYAAPPVDTLGASTGLRVGAHQAHVAGRAYSSGIACQDCHPRVATYTTAHATGVAEVAFTNGTSASFNVGTYTPRTGTTAASCSATWCHAVKSASGQSAGGTLATPTWNGTITSCTRCHGVSPSTGMHRSEHGGYPCGYCHPGYASTASANGTTVNPAVHVNGARDVGGTGTRIRTWNAATRSCQPTCHGSERW